MSSTERARPGGQPSTTQPIAGPWLSPNDVTVNMRPNELPAMEWSLPIAGCSKSQPSHPPNPGAPRRAFSPARPQRAKRRDVEPLSDARTKLADFFNILLLDEIELDTQLL